MRLNSAIGSRGGICLYKLRKFIKNCDGVSEVIGEVLLVGIVVIFFSVTSIFVFSSDKPVDSPNADLQIWVNETSDTVYIKHRGGEPFRTGEVKVVILINGTENVFTPENISAKLGADESWEMGDVVEIGIQDELGIPIESGNQVELFLVHIPSKQMLQRTSFTVS